MTRKDYKLIADLIASTNTLVAAGRIDARVGLAILANAFCEDALLDNPRFSKKLFLAACGVK